MRITMIAAALLLAAPAAAQTDQRMSAMNLGEIVGKAEACGLTINEDALVAYMQERGLTTIDLTALIEHGRAYETRREQTPAACAAVKAAATEAGLVNSL